MPDGKFLLSVGECIDVDEATDGANEFRSMVRERTKKALAERKRCGEVYSPTPFGYRRQGLQLLSDPGEQAIVSRIRELRRAGRPLREIASALNQERVPTKKGRRWYASTVGKILDNSLHRSQA